MSTQAFLSKQELFRYLPQIVRLATPIALNRLTIILMVMIDIAVVGHFAGADLGAQAAGSAVAGTLMLVVFGLTYGVQVELAQAFGRGEAGQASSVAQSSFREMGRILRLGVLLALFWSLIAFVPALFAVPFFTLTGQDPEIIPGAATIWLIMAGSVPFAAIIVLASGFLEVLKRPMPALYISIAALFVNFLLNMLLVRGWGPIPPMGAVGSAWATFFIRFLQLVPLFLVVYLTVDREKFGLDTWRFRIPGDQQSKIFKLGFAVGMSQGIEASAFTALVLMAGWLGAVVLGGFNIAFNFLALMFMLSLGIAGAATVLVGNAIGANDLRRARAMGFLSWGTNAVLMVVLGVVIALLALPLTKLLTGEAAYIAVAAPLVVLTGFIHIVDGGQVIFSHSNRAAGDSWVSTGLHICSYWLVMIPGGYLLSQTFGRGERGLFEAVIIASIVSCGLLAWRFIQLTRPQV